MKIQLVSVPLAFLIACGGSQKKPAPAPVKPVVAVKPVEKKPPPEPEPPPPPPPPQEWSAAARLEPVKGIRMPAFAITFFQVEGESTRARTDGPIAKLKAGKYHLVLHEGTECGPKANKAGPVRLNLSEGSLLVATRKETPAVDVESEALPLDGDGSIVGQALVLHADKRGKPGNPVACGLVVSQGGDEDVVEMD